MIQLIKIKNFKSIKELEFPCKKLNIFIGEPNSGKSNIIEALALKSRDAIGSELNRSFFRYRNVGDLFFDFNINEPIIVQFGDGKTKLIYAIRDTGVPENEFHFLLDESQDASNPTRIAHDGKVTEPGNPFRKEVQIFQKVRFYEYKRIMKFTHTVSPYLAVPHGENLPGLLLANPEHKRWVSEVFQSKGLKLNLNPVEQDILISKIVDDTIYSYPYSSISETLQRIVFYIMAIRTNQNSILLFDEPESNTFPFYTKYLAEQIALDRTNQFFIATHNPYLLLSLIEKSKSDNLNVCVSEMKDYRTIIHVLDENQISQVLDFNTDVFFNFDQILGE
jgi:AAA15 family ATPase/GTPase